LVFAALAYSTVLLFLAFQAFVPELCTKWLCDQINIPRDRFGLHMVFGFNALFLAGIWFAVVAIESLTSRHWPTAHSRHAWRAAWVGGIASAAVTLGALVLPLAVALVYMLAALAGLALAPVVLLK
jgi:hypothetical protein